MYVRVLLLALLAVVPAARIVAPGAREAAPASRVALPGTGAPDRGRASDWEERMLDQIDAERARRGLPRFQRNRRLELAAAEHSRRMAAAGEIAHRLPGEPGLRDRVASTGLRFSAAGENVGYSTRVEDLHSNLMRSPHHRENLLSDEYTAIGIAIVQSGNRHYVTQDFARATSEASAPEAEDEFAAAVIALRQRNRGLTPVAIESSRAMREAACAMARRDRLDAGQVPHPPGQRRALAFTAFEPGELSRAASRVATDPDTRRITIGVCHRESPRYPSGVFWFAISY